MLGDPETPAVHIVPEEETDIVPHDLAEDCICGPTTEPVECADGSINWLYSHHSLDGREQREAN